MDILLIADFETKGKQKVDVHYVNIGTPYVIVEENLEGYNADDAASLLEDLLCQETVYQSLQGTRRNDVARASSSTHPGFGYDRGQSSGSSSTGQPSDSMNFESLDEALARELQYEEDKLTATSFSETTLPAAVPEGASPNPATDIAIAMGISDLATRQDDIDPDNMTYEELQSLGEAIGTESRGLSDALISYLPTSTYKTRFFSRKDKNEECVICRMSYKNREALTTLPCKHYYHSQCVETWLQISKVCPVCKREIYGS